MEHIVIILGLALWGLAVLWPVFVLIVLMYLSARLIVQILEHNDHREF